MEAKTSEWRPGPTVCRCCLTEGCYKDISTEYFWMGKREVYAEMLADTLNLTIAYSQSGGPNSNSRLICEPCISRLRDAADFKRQVQECEKTFLQHLDPSTSGIVAEDVSRESILKGKQVKIELVKLEKDSDDDDFEPSRFTDDDDVDDDIDDQPLTKLAKTPKKETVDLLDLIDNAKVAEKRKSTTKVKATPVKKAKQKKDTKATANQDKPEKKKKEDNDPYTIARRNAEIVVKFATAYPFRLPEDAMVCVYCGESCDDPMEYRKHMDIEHQTFHVRMAFVHCNEGYIKVDCTELRCRICLLSFDTIIDVAKHLKDVHQEKVDTNYEIGVYPFKLEKDRLLCAICKLKSPCIRQLSRHIQTHFLKYTCDACGKSYATSTTLKHHITYSHTGEARICRKCKKTFSSLEAKRQHLVDTPKCWSHLCNVCGERFISWTLKQAHLAQVHGTPKRSHVCLECGETFLDRKKYRVHFKISHTDDNYVCSCCGLKFATKRNLEEHRVVHTKEKLFHCTVCSKSFPRKKNLVQHMWIHSEQKRFGCDLCNKQFNQRVSWKTHMKSYHPDLVNFETNKNIKLMVSLLKTDT
ncbi:PREDICTED: GDNF-inducible zinc finger protein 1 isoform X6 [Papilio xuthus]|uniref:GDNF-inducible zinc finger protein 1 isoform X6 n=1 Tax=Papilio xuthus TaxID=66420 RepID=A0AAJ6Z297_PAPXU|nr:PREDICTED: GDNF-inducible zinc finger protein 1 isoform X6 [Papilio xuthus]